MNVCKFSQDRKYRYRLDFEHRYAADSADRRVVWILLNPSTADENALDPTLRRVRTWSEGWGYRYITIVNLFAWRATKPASLLRVPDPIGPDNDREILQAVEEAAEVVLAWGAIAPRLRPRARAVEELLEKADQLEGARSLGVTKAGEPRHPLYLPGGTELEDYTPWQLWVDRGDVEVLIPGSQ
jgi:hypothetical protein